MSSLHIPSLLLANGSVVTLCGLLMLFSWWRGRTQPALLWNGCMLLLAAIGLLCNALRGLGFDWLPIIVGNMLLLFCAGMNWTVMRVLCGRAPRWPWLFSGALVWWLLCQWPAFYQNLSWRILAHTLLMSCFMLLAMRELWRARRKLQVSVLPALLLIGLHTLFYVMRMLISVQHTDRPLQENPLFPVLLVESMLYAVGIAFVVLAMVKEQLEQRYRLAAYSDPLTGIGNRRAFLDSGERLLGLCQRQQQPVALLLFDLDHFKAVNDRFGHSSGDKVLQAFSQGAQLQLRRADVFGRIGGEEFACLIHGRLGDALQLAERMRQGFAEHCVEQHRHTVSVGVAASDQAGYDLERLLALADAALYRAKHAGRNRVMAHGADMPPQGVPSC